MADENVTKATPSSFEETTVLESYSSLPTRGTPTTGNTPGKSSYANVTGKPSGKKLNIRTLFTPGGNGIDVVVPVESIRAISDRFANTTYGFFLGKKGRSSYARVMIELRADVECASCKVFGHIHEECPKNTGVGEKKTLKKPSQTSRGVPVGSKMGFKPHKEYRHVPKNPNACSSGNKNKSVEPTIEVSNSNPFDVLNSVDNDVELGTNGGTTNLVNNKVNSSGSSFMNIDNSSTGTTPIIDKIGKFEDLLCSGQAILVDNVGNPLKKVKLVERVGFDIQSLLEQWRDSYGNSDYDDDPYDDDLSEFEIIMSSGGLRSGPRPSHGDISGNGGAGKTGQQAKMGQLGNYGVLGEVMLKGTHFGAQTKSSKNVYVLKENTPYYLGHFRRIKDCDESKGPLPDFEEFHSFDAWWCWLVLHGLIMNCGFLDMGRRKNNHRKKVDTVLGSSSATVDEIMNDATPLVDVAAAKEDVSSSMDDENVTKATPSLFEETTVLESYPPLPTRGTPTTGDTPGKSSYDNVTGKPSGKKLNIHTLFTPGVNGIDVVVPVESIHDISDRFANTTYGFFLGKKVAYLVVDNYVMNTWDKYRLACSMFSSSTEDVSTIPVWVKLHGVPVTAFSDDGLSVIATKLGTPLMLDSYTSDMCIQSSCQVEDYVLVLDLHMVISVAMVVLGNRPAEADESAGSDSALDTHV
ncbi:reverse transcriptase domain-containing protein [Tanacetum coccineum]